MKNEMREQRGITLIALVITIIVLIILAGVAINLTLGENGILKKTTSAKEQYKQEAVREEISMALASIKTEAISKQYNIQLSDLTDENSEYSLEKETKINWIDKNSNPVVVEKDGFYCFIYDDLTNEISRENTTYQIITNLQNLTLSNNKTRIPQNSQYSTKLISDKFYSIDNIEILMGTKDITSEVYDSENNTINIANLTDNVNITITSKIELDNPEVLAKLVDENYNYTTMDEILNDNNLLENIYNNDVALDYVLNSQNIILPEMISNSNSFEFIINNLEIFTKVCDNTETFNKICNNVDAFTKVCNNADAFTKVCNSSTLRLALYNNYSVTENIIARSQVALNVMKKSSNYVVIKKNVNKYAGRIEFTRFYSGKAFVLGMSQDRNTDSGFKTEVRTILSVSGGVVKATANTTYGTTGLVYPVNKFASIVDLDPYGRDPSQSSIDININGYVAIFKI